MSLRSTMFVATIFFAFFAPMKGISASTQKPILIDTYEEDITNDGVQETIQLKGTLFAKDSSFYRFVWADITSDTEEEWTVHFPSSFQPTLHFTDLMNNGKMELLYEGTPNNSENFRLYTLHAFTNNNFNAIALPDESFAHGSLQNNFLAHMSISPHEDPVIVDLKEDANTYIDQGIYNEDGTLLDRLDVFIQPIHKMEPSLNKRKNRTELMTVQDVPGIDPANPLGRIESTWIFETNQWRLLKSTWK